MCVCTPLCLKWVTKSVQILPMCFFVVFYFSCSMQHTNFRLLNYVAAGETFVDAVEGRQAASKRKQMKNTTTTITAAQQCKLIRVVTKIIQQDCGITEP